MRARSRAERLALFHEVDVYPVTSQASSAGRSSLEVLDAVIRGGARIVQLREKELGDREMFELAAAFRERTARAGMLLVIDDRVDVALAVGADGVHLGLEDLPVAEARRLAPELIVGASTHSAAEAVLAQRQGADTVNVGPIYPTATKPSATRFLGLEGLRDVIPHLRVPWSVMGGIKHEHVSDLVASGARHIAVVTAITAAPDPEEATRRFVRAIEAARAGCDRTTPRQREVGPWS